MVNWLNAIYTYHHIWLKLFIPMFLMKQCACEIIAQHVNIFSFFDFKVINVPTDIVSVFNIYNCITLEINGAVFDETAFFFK
jgi:hypothetical protein